MSVSHVMTHCYCNSGGKESVLRVSLASALSFYLQLFKTSLFQIFFKVQVYSSTLSTKSFQQKAREAVPKRTLNMLFSRYWISNAVDNV